MVVVEAVARLRERGRTVVVVAHRAALVALADDVIDLDEVQRREPQPVAAGGVGA
jgi:ATP-binding cassette subfamily C protein CydD